MNFPKTAGLANADAIKKTIADLLESSTDQFEVFNVNINDHFLSIRRYRDIYEQVKLSTWVEANRLDEARWLLTTLENVPQKFGIHNIIDLSTVLPIFHFSGLKELSLFSSTQQNLDPDTLMNLTGHGKLLRVQLDAEGMLFDKETFRRIREHYVIQLSLRDGKSSLNLHGIKRHDNYRPPIHISIKGNNDLKFLEDIYAEDKDIELSFALDNPFDPVILGNLLAHPRLVGLSFHQNEMPFVISEDLCSWLIQSNLKYFHVNAPEVLVAKPVKKQFKTHWRAHDDGFNHDFNRIDQNANVDIKKRVTYTGPFLFDNLPSKKPFFLDLVNVIDITSLIQALKHPQLQEVHIYAKEQFTLTQEFINEISEQVQINFIRIEGNFNLLPGVLNYVRNFHHVSVYYDEKNGDHISFGRRSDGQNELSASLYNEGLSIDINGLREIISMPNLERLSLIGHVPISDQVFQLFEKGKTLKTVNLVVINDFSGVSNWSPMSHIDELYILNDNNESVRSRILPLIKGANLGKVVIRNFSESKNHIEKCLIGAGITDQFLPQQLSIGAEARIMPAEREGAKYQQPTVEVSLINTSLTGDFLNNGDYGVLKLIATLDLSGSDNFKLEHLVDFAKNTTSCTKIILPAVLASEIASLTQQFPLITFLAEDNY